MNEWIVTNFSKGIVTISDLSICDSVHGSRGTFDKFQTEGENSRTFVTDIFKSIWQFDLKVQLKTTFIPFVYKRTYKISDIPKFAAFQLTAHSVRVWSDSVRHTHLGKKIRVSFPLRNSAFAKLAATNLECIGDGFGPPDQGGDPGNLKFRAYAGRINLTNRSCRFVLSVPVRRIPDARQPKVCSASWKIQYIPRLSRARLPPYMQRSAVRVRARAQASVQEFICFRQNGYRKIGPPNVYECSRARLYRLFLDWAIKVRRLTVTGRLTWEFQVEILSKRSNRAKNCISHETWMISKGTLIDILQCWLVEDVEFEDQICFFKRNCIFFNATVRAL